MKIFKKIISGIFVIAVVGTLFYGAYYTIKQYISVENPDSDYSYFENRLRSAFPAAESARLLDGSFFTDVESFVVDHMLKRDKVLELDTRLNMDIIKRPVVNDVVVTEDALLPFNEYETVNKEEIGREAEVIADNCRKHTDTAKKYGGNFIYVAVPCQYVCYEKSYPSYLNNRCEYTADECEALFSMFDLKGVDYIDMYGIFQNDGMPDGYTSPVDNHYNIEGAYRTYEAIIDRINEKTNFNIAKLDNTNSYIKKLPNRYLGSRNRKLFGLWECDTHLGILLPNTPIDFERYDYSKKTVPTVYTLPENDTDDVLYTLYMYGDIGNTIIDTHREELPSILIYGDSFTNPVESIIYNNFDCMHSIDYRAYDGMSVDEYIEKYKPEIVVCIRDYESMLNPALNGQ